MSGREHGPNPDGLIFHGPRIVALDGTEPEAIAVLHERVVASGSLRRMAERFPDARQVRLEGALVVPGFNDAHLHPFLSSQALLRENLAPSATPTTAEAVAKLRARAARARPGEWIVGVAYDATRVAGPRLTRAALDAVSATNPVYVVTANWHAAVANTAALAAAGLHDASDSPPGGELTSDEQGELDGWVYEQAHIGFVWGSADAPPLVPAADLDAAVDALVRENQYLHSLGITSYCDAVVTPEAWQVYSTARRTGRLTPRVGLLLWNGYADAAAGVGLTSDLGDERLRLVGVKVMYDGALSSGTCLCAEPYESATGTGNGIQIVDHAEYADFVRRMHARGIRVATHANGDVAIARVLDAIEDAQRAFPEIAVNHRVEHCSMVDDHVVARIRAAGVTPVPFSGFVADHGEDLVRIYGEQRASRMLRHRSMIDGGVLPAGSSDYPCGPASVLAAIRSMVTRRTHGGRILGEDETVSVLDALRIYTQGSAASTGESNTKGTLAPGHLADFVVLDRDLFAVDPAEIAAVRVRSTWVGGRAVWSA